MMLTLYKIIKAMNMKYKSISKYVKIRFNCWFFRIKVIVYKPRETIYNNLLYIIE